MRKIKEYYITIVLVVLVIVVNLGAFATYITNIRSNLAEQTNSHVDDIMDEAVECINIKLEEQINTMDTLALFASTMYKHPEDNNILDEALEEQRKQLKCSILEIVTLDGKGEKTGVDYSNENFFENAIDGKTVMQEISEDGTVNSVAFAAPIYDKNTDEVVEVLVAKMDVSKFSESMELSSFNQNGKVFIVKKDGTLISKSKGLSSANSISDIFPEKKFEEQLVSNMRSRNSGIITYEGDSTTRYIGYSKLLYNKWYVVCIISSSAVEANPQDITTDVLILGVEIGMMLLVLVAYLIYNIISVKNKGNMNLERYFIATKYADTIMFDYSIAKDTMYSNEKWEKVFGYKLPKANVKETLIDFVADEDKELYVEKINELMEKKENLNFEIRIIDKDKKTYKCSVKVFPIFERKGRITKIIALIEDVEDKWTEQK